MSKGILYTQLHLLIIFRSKVGGGGCLLYTSYYMYIWKKWVKLNFTSIKQFLPRPFLRNYEYNLVKIVCNPLQIQNSEPERRKNLGCISWYIMHQRLRLLTFMELITGFQWKKSLPQKQQCHISLMSVQTFLHHVVQIFWSHSIFTPQKPQTSISAAIWKVL